MKYNVWEITAITPYVTESGMVRPAIHLHNLTTDEKTSISGNNYKYINRHEFMVGTKLREGDSLRMSQFKFISNQGFFESNLIPLTCPECQSKLVRDNDVWFCQNYRCPAILRGIVKRLFARVPTLKKIYSSEKANRLINNHEEFTPLDLIDVNSTLKNFAYRPTIIVTLGQLHFKNINTMLTSIVKSLTLNDLLRILVLNISSKYADYLTDDPLLTIDDIKKLSIREMVCLGIKDAHARDIKYLFNLPINTKMIEQFKQLKHQANECAQEDE